MCLFSNEFSPRTAIEPITCYKTVNIISPYRREKMQGAVFESAYYGFHYALKQTYAERRFNPMAVNNIVSVGFHSWSSMKKAEEDCCCLPGRDVILKCEIPAGARYFVGDNEDYCSDIIKVVAWKHPGAEHWWHEDTRQLM